MTYHDRTPRKSQKSDPVGEVGLRARNAASRCGSPSGAGSRSRASSTERSAVSPAPRSIGSKPMPNGPIPRCRTTCGRTVRSGSSKNALRPERCAELSRKKSATRRPPRKWTVNAPSMAQPMFRKAEAGKRHASECRRGAQASPAACVATTVPRRTDIGQAFRTVRPPARRRFRNPSCLRARI